MMALAKTSLLFILYFLSSQSQALQWSADQALWNLNQNETAIDPLDYWGQWPDHEYNPSPKSWRFPFYMLTLDRYVDGDPTNNDANGTAFENDWMTTQFRFGGDARGLMKHLDYIQGLGIRAIYLSGSPFINQPWASDGFGPLDFTLLDHHHGTIADWRALIDEMHARDMYVILDNTIATMGDLLTFKGWETKVTPFDPDEYDVLWKTDRKYHDFNINNTVLEPCQYPVFWDNDGNPVNETVTRQFHSCRNSDFDQYGDMQGVGYVPPYQSQLSKFASVQDRLRLWKQDVLDKVMHFSCMQIAMLDIDGFRVDKALQTPTAELAQWASYQRDCARRFGKKNFLITGEAVGELKFSSVFFGRGKSPNMYFTNTTEAQLANGDTPGYIREFGNTALDGAAFHYPTYGAMTRFLGLDGDIGFEGVDFAQHWNSYLLTDDMVNAETGKFDPRHMFGMTNQDVFRWPALDNGTQRQVLGFFITFLEMPGIPMVMWGEEQEFKVLENLASDYIFGRQPMASTRAWQIHGCYKVGAAGNGYYDMPFGDSLTACEDDNVSLDQRNPAHPLRNLLKRMFELRNIYPVLNDGFTLQTLFTDTRDIFLPHSGQLPTPLGIWSVYRGRTPGVQDFTDQGMGNQGIWLMYSNQNDVTTYAYDCNNPNPAGSLIAPFPQGTTIKNLFYPYEEYTLDSSMTKLGIEGSDEFNGCLPSIELEAWGYKAFVPVDKFVGPAPVITGAFPQHDARIKTDMGSDDTITLPITLLFSREMNCTSIIGSILLNSTTQTGIVPSFDASSVVCQNATATSQRFVGEVISSFQWTANLVNVSHGVHTYTVVNATSADGLSSTNTKDLFMLRVGASDNPVVFPETANYTTGLIYRDELSGRLSVKPRAAGASMWRFSTNWGANWSNWTAYDGEAFPVEEKAWAGTGDGDIHIVTQYWSDMLGSTAHMQHSDFDLSTPRRWPHVHVQGAWNKFGYDAGLNDKMHQDSQGLWNFDLSTEWPSSVILNIWGMKDGTPDKSAAYGDVDGDGTLDWVSPDSLSFNQLNITHAPIWPFTAYRITTDDGTFSYKIQPIGSAPRQVAIYFLLAIGPIISACIAVAVYQGLFYRLNFNTTGLNMKSYPFNQLQKGNKLANILPSFIKKDSRNHTTPETSEAGGLVVVEAQKPVIRTMLIATMEYMIPDWDISIKIGGLGVMAGLMNKHLGHHNLIWVVPCVGDVQYPTDRMAEPMKVHIMGKPYLIDVQYHTVGTTTYVLLDAPLFRQQTKKIPYPSRMDDMDSAIYYAAWNACIAEAIKRFPEVDIYHINDYHGAIAPLYLLPRVIPCCLSLHNAEFQGLWSINTPERLCEISEVFNLDPKVIKKYVQWGDNFNLLHAGASYLRIHQKGFGAVGVSKKYGKRSYARYPIFWSLPKIGILPNPDPADIEAWDKQLPDSSVIIDPEYEASRRAFRKQAQEWAGLNIDETAELIVFVGRWSMQKGVDLIADVFPAILQEKPNTQLICVGPTIDLYGKFAALKLEKLMKLYPGRIYSKPEFVYVPPYVHAGAEFALIPSRDEPFGLVSVEFGRKGALGIGARVGGLGQMPGWWFNIESATTQHMLSQFKAAIKAALASDYQTRALMRARCSKQRFPVAQWVEDLEILQLKAIKVNIKMRGTPSAGIPDLPEAPITPRSATPSSMISDSDTEPTSSHGSRLRFEMRHRAGSWSFPSTTASSRVVSRSTSRASSPERAGPVLDHSALTRRLSMLPECLDVEIDSSSIDIEIGDRDHPLGRNIPSPTYKGEDRIVSDHGNPPLPTTYSTPLVSSHNTPLVSSYNTPMASGYNTPIGKPSESVQLLRKAFTHHRRSSTLSVHEVVGERSDYKLQDVDQTFTDSQMSYYHMFESMLASLDSRNSENKLCIESFLQKAEKNWYSRFYEAKLGKTTVSLPDVGKKHGVSVNVRERSSMDDSERGSPTLDTFGAISKEAESNAGQFMISPNHKPPTGVARFMMYKFRDWPLYAFFLAFGQIISASSYQVTIITGASGESAEKLYAVASIYLIGSIFWWCLLRRVASKWALSLPFLGYALAFFLVGIAPYGPSIYGRGWIQNVATGFYSFASASGSLFFARNFGSEGGVNTQTLIFRACSVQGTQQLWIAALWYWGDAMSANSLAQFSHTVLNTRSLVAITTPIAVLLGAIGILLFFGLPEYYSASPGSAPSFYKSITTRKIVMWFLFTVVVQNYWLSAPYGRNWEFLFNSTKAPTWIVAMLLVVFFIGVWGGLLYIMARFSKYHSWFLPIFGVGLGAPRWCQILWSSSGMGVYLPWGSALGSVVAGRSLWLWLGVLDALQGVGIGAMLLQTMTRSHLTVTMIAAQVVGSVATMAARASSPDATGPGMVFPNLAVSLDGLEHSGFWVCLCFQLIIPIGFLLFFRDEQLFKP